jgi:hypothetical protein
MAVRGQTSSWRLPFADAFAEDAEALTDALHAAASPETAVALSSSAASSGAASPRLMAGSGPGSARWRDRHRPYPDLNPRSLSASPGAYSSGPASPIGALTLSAPPASSPPAAAPRLPLAPPPLDPAELAAAIAAAAASASAASCATAPVLATTFGDSGVPVVMSISPLDAQLLRAAAMNDAPAVTRLLAMGASVNARGPSHLTPLLAAAAGTPATPGAPGTPGGDADADAAGAHVVQLLAEQGADVLAVDDSGWSAVCFAAHGGRAATLAALLQLRASPTAPDARGMTPLMHAARHDHAALVDRLLHVRAPHVNAQDATGWTALHWAMAVDARATVRLLAAYARVDVKLASLQGETCVHVAARHGHTAASAALATARPAEFARLVRTETADMRTPADLARDRCHQDTAAFLAPERHARHYQARGPRRQTAAGTHHDDDDGDIAEFDDDMDDELVGGEWVAVEPPTSDEEATAPPLVTRHGRVSRDRSRR